MLGRIFRCLPDRTDLGKVGHQGFHILEVEITNHNFVLNPVIWVQPEVDASLKGHNSGEAA